jgi:hypothetical protein
MMPRRPPRFHYPKPLLLTPRPKANLAETPQGQQPKPIKKEKQKGNGVKQGQSDPKLAAAIIELAEGISASAMLKIGPGAVRVPRDIVGLHLDFAKAFPGGHMGARSLTL